MEKEYNLRPGPEVQKAICTPYKMGANNIPIWSTSVLYSYKGKKFLSVLYCHGKQYTIEVK